MHDFREIAATNEQLKALEDLPATTFRGVATTDTRTVLKALQRHGTYYQNDAEDLKIRANRASLSTQLGFLTVEQAQSLTDVGMSIPMLMNAGQSEIADVEGIGNALSARIKAKLSKLDKSTEVESTEALFECDRCGAQFKALADHRDAHEGSFGFEIVGEP